MTAQVVGRDVGCLYGDSPANSAGKVGNLDKPIDLKAPWQHPWFFEFRVVATQFMPEPVDEMY